MTPDERATKHAAGVRLRNAIFERLDHVLAFEDWLSRYEQEIAALARRQWR